MPSIFLSFIALAEETEPTDANAHEVFEEAKTLYHEGRFTEASQKFREANRLRPAWKLYFNIAQCEAAAKRNGLALEAFERYLTLGGDEIPEERRGTVMSELKRLRPIVGYVDVPPEPAGATVTVDGFERGTTPLSGSIMVAAGIDHHITIEYKGEVVLKRRVKVGGEEKTKVDIHSSSELEKPSNVTTELPPSGAVPAPAVSAPAAVPVPPSRELGSVRRAIGWTGVGMGAALLLSGAVTGGVALGQYAELDDKCPDNRCTSETDFNIGKKADNLALATDILLPIGAVIGTAGIVLLVLSRKAHRETPKVGVKPVLEPRRGGYMLEGKF